MNNDIILIWYSSSLKSLLSSCQQHRRYHLTPLEPSDGVFGFKQDSRTFRQV